MHRSPSYKVQWTKLHLRSTTLLYFLKHAACSLVNSCFGTRTRKIINLKIIVRTVFTVCLFKYQDPHMLKVH